jgi:hypothetical protein
LQYLIEGHTVLNIQLKIRKPDIQMDSSEKYPLENKEDGR